MSDEQRCPHCDQRVHRVLSPHLREPMLLDFTPDVHGLWRIVHEAGERTARVADPRKLKALPAAERPRLFSPHDCDPSPVDR